VAVAHFCLVRPMKRFSFKAFIVAIVVHLAGTVALIDASFRALLEFKRTGIDSEPVWLSVWAWIWQPTSMLVSYYLRHHPPPPVATTNLDDFLRAPSWGPSESIFYCMLPWSVFVATVFGFLVPWLLRWRSESHLTNR
jgi:hypothetical protein